MTDTIDETPEYKPKFYGLMPDRKTPVALNLDEFIAMTKDLGDDWRQVAYTPIFGRAAWVSTVFLSIDHSYGDGPPILWETMIFCECCPGCGIDKYQVRYPSYNDAQFGHYGAILFAQSKTNLRWYINAIKYHVKGIWQLIRSSM